MTLRTFIKSVVGICILPSATQAVDTKRQSDLIKKWWPILATDEEYFKSYGHHRPTLSTCVLLEAQESYINNKQNHE